MVMINDDNDDATRPKIRHRYSQPRFSSLPHT